MANYPYYTMPMENWNVLNSMTNIFYGYRNNNGSMLLSKTHNGTFVKLAERNEPKLFEDYDNYYDHEFDLIKFIRKGTNLTKKEKTMNYSTALFLINKNLRAILAAYEPGTGAAKIMFKTLDPNIKVDDYVIVPTNTRCGMTVVKVTDVDVEVDFDSDKHVDLVVGKVDKTTYDQLVIQERQALDVIRGAEAANKRDELKKKLLAHAQEQIKALPIYANGGDN